MSQKTKSTTEKETWVEESLFGLGSHHKTTISDGNQKVEGRGRTSEESQRIASDKYKRR
jgi:hypothetical protein